MSNIAIIEPRPSLVAGGRPQAIVPTDMDSAYRFAKAVCIAGMAPKGMETPEKCMIAIMRGMEVGLTPFMALDKIAIVNGRPTIWGDGALGLVRGSGLCEYIKEWIEGEGDKRVAWCESKRRGESEPIRRKFSVADAKKAGLWGKQGPWQQFEERMMQMRARGFCLRDGFADVLGGLYLREEIEDDTRETRRAPAPTVAAAIEHKPISEASQSAPVETQALVTVPRRAPPPPSIAPKSTPPAPTVETIDAAEALAEFEEAAQIVRDENGLNEIWDDLILPLKDKMFPPDFEAANTIYRRALERLQQ